mmetsp:Transcript_29469/g.76065  ORF Transcript_29469/g.76065 Transcript_29469/m.76065 type:complete len:452 (-) Transcript_29469:1372-2727(-)
MGRQQRQKLTPAEKERVRHEKRKRRDMKRHSSKCNLAFALILRLVAIPLLVGMFTFLVGSTTLAHTTVVYADDPLKFMAPFLSFLIVFRSVQTFGRLSSANSACTKLYAKTREAAVSAKLLLSMQKPQLEEEEKKRRSLLFFRRTSAFTLLVQQLFDASSITKGACSTLFCRHRTVPPLEEDVDFDVLRKKGLLDGMEEMVDEVEAEKREFLSLFSDSILSSVTDGLDTSSTALVRTVKDSLAAAVDAANEGLQLKRVPVPVFYKFCLDLLSYIFFINVPFVFGSNAAHAAITSVPASTPSLNSTQLNSTSSTPSVSTADASANQALIFTTLTAVAIVLVINILLVVSNLMEDPFQVGSIQRVKLDEKMKDVRADLRIILSIARHEVEGEGEGEGEGGSSTSPLFTSPTLAVPPSTSSFGGEGLHARAKGGERGGGKGQSGGYEMDEYSRV